MTRYAPPLLVANWKMHGLLAESMRNLKELRGYLLSQLVSSEVVICPPFTLLRDFAEKIPGCGLKLGAQDCHSEPTGAFTGDISAAMLRDLSCEYVILGHSERRTHHNESNELIAKKARAAHQAGLISIICVGESEKEHQAKKTQSVIEAQLAASLPEGANASNTVIAYEPVWAIGSNRTPSLYDIESVHHHIINVFQTLTQSQAPRVLYGGSVQPDNAEEILRIPTVGGLLIGRASLHPKQFWHIIERANHIMNAA